LGLPAFLLPLLLLACSSWAGRPGIIAFSDGSSAEGEITLTPGSSLTLHDGKDPHTVPLEAVREVRFTPEKETMERAWRFIEAGQAKKELWGKPYPVRHLAASLQLRDETGWSGHLHTLPLYVTVTGVTTKIVILAKQRGKPGETLESLVYPLSIRFDDPAGASNRMARLTLKPDPANAALCALTKGSLVRLPGNRQAGSDPFLIDAPLGAPLFVAVQNGDNLRVAWTNAASPEVDAAIRQAVADARDFFDQRRVMGVWQAPGEDDVYALVDLVRAGQTTLGGNQTQPWRLEIWRFKMEPDSRKLMLAARNWFFRGITAPGKPRPPATTDNTLTWTVDESPAGH
jgi:hypothetical protein